jgi:hypothetical protein
VVHSCDSGATNVPGTRLNKIFFGTVIDELDSQNLLNNRVQSKVLKATYDVCPCAAHTFIFVGNAKLVH